VEKGENLLAALLYFCTVRPDPYLNVFRLRYISLSTQYSSTTYLDVSRRSPSRPKSSPQCFPLFTTTNPWVR
jgi:hypothetical protein